MRKSFIFQIMIFLILALGNCISLKINPLPLPENMIEEIALCRKIDDSGELLKPLEITTDFRQDIEYVICFVSLRDVSQEIRLKWKWYSPDQELFKESKEVTVNKNVKFLEYVTAYDRITPGEEPKALGRWVVVVFMNDELIASKAFKVNSKE